MRSVDKLLTGAVLCALVSALALAQFPAPPAPAAPPAPPAAAVKVVFHRPFVKGDSYKLTVNLKDREDGSQGIEEEYAVLAGTVHVMDVNAIGDPSVFMIHVDKAETGPSDKMKKMKLEGADIGISFPSGTPRFVRRDNQPISEEESGLLSMLFRAPRDIRPDDYLGPGKEVRPGDTWPMNKELLSKALYGKAFDSKNAPDLSKQEATVTFVGAETWNGIPCYRIKTKITIKNPEGSHFVGDFLMETSQDLLLPVDPSVKKSKKAWEMYTEMRGYQISPQDGQKMEMRGKSRLTTETTVE